jgi:hypothetical protein
MPPEARRHQSISVDACLFVARSQSKKDALAEIAYNGFWKPRDRNSVV